MCEFEILFEENKLKSFKECPIIQGDYKNFSRIMRTELKLFSKRSVFFQQAK